MTRVIFLVSGFERCQSRFAVEERERYSSHVMHEAMTPLRVRAAEGRRGGLIGGPTWVEVSANRNARVEFLAAHGERKDACIDTRAGATRSVRILLWQRRRDLPQGCVPRENENKGTEPRVRTTLPCEQSGLRGLAGTSGETIVFFARCCTACCCLMYAF